METRATGGKPRKNSGSADTEQVARQVFLKRTHRAMNFIARSAFI